MFLMASGYSGMFQILQLLLLIEQHATLPLSGFALTAVWVANAVPRPPAKRAAAISIVNGFGNMGNL